MILMKHRLIVLVLSIGLIGAGCVHRIHVVLPPDEISAGSLPISVQLDVPFLAIEGADHMPGIPLLEWQAKDLQQTILDYFIQRQTFMTIGLEPAETRLVVKAWLTLRAPDRYLYRVHLESDFSFTDHSILKTYAAEGEATGRSVRWVTASDQEPITEATAQALHQLASQIEQDRELTIRGKDP
ncbi:MAG: hypothetical protein K0S45_3620 [Nitrospira sp.]|jgi:hypothetical protein|nr:hypothetical protein [Nitrospira sp.]